MRIFILCFVFVITSFFAVKADNQLCELNLKNWLPEQIPFSKLILESENIQAHVMDHEGTQYPFSDYSSWPQMQEIAEIYIHGPQVKFILMTNENEKITASLDSITLDFTQQFLEGRRIVKLDLALTPAQDENAASEREKILSSLVANIARTIILGGDEPIQLILTYTSDEDTGANPKTEIHAEIAGGTIELGLDNSEKNKEIQWKLKGDLSGDPLFFNRIVSVLQIIGKGSSFINVDGEYKENYKQMLSYMERVADFTQIFRGWDGMGFELSGRFGLQYLEEDSFRADITSRYQLEAVNGSWSASLGTETVISGGENKPLLWSQTILITDPSENVLKIARWVQNNAIEDLAVFLNTPSLRYLGRAGEKFAQTLANMIEMMGNRQEECLYFFVGRDESSLKVGSTPVNQVGALLYKKIKEKMTWW